MLSEIIVILMVQSDLSPYSKASTSNTRLFIAQVVFVGATALGTLLFAWLLFKSGNNVQDAIREEAKADIERTRHEASVEIERIKSDAARSKQESDETIAELNAGIAKANETAALAGERAATLLIVTSRQNIRRDFAGFFAPHMARRK